MASAQEYAQWIVQNADKQGTPEFETVAKAYKLASGNDSAPKQDLKKSRPGDFDPSSPEWQAKYGATAGNSAFENFAAGAGKAVYDTGRGIKQLALGAADLVSPRDAGPNGKPVSRYDEYQQQIDGDKALDAPLMKTTGGVLGNIAGQGALAYLGGVGATGLLSRVPMGAQAFAAANAARDSGQILNAARLGIPALGGAVYGGLQPVATGDSRLFNVGMGAAGGAAGEGAAGALARFTKGANLSDEVRAGVQKADELGIPLRADQITKSRATQAAAAGADMLPFSGSKAFADKQAKAFNQAVSRTIGEADQNVVAAVGNAERNLGAKFDSVLQNHSVKADGEFINGLDGILKNAKNELTEQQFGVVQRQVNNLLEKVQAGDVIDGQAAYNIKKGLDRIGKSNDTSLAHYAGDLRVTLMDALNRSLPDDVAQGFAKTREQYGNLIQLRKLIPNGFEGNVSPARIANIRGARGDLQDVADVAAQFLKEPFGNSGTAQRVSGAAGLLGAGAALANPALAFPLVQAAATGATAGRGLNALLNSKDTINYLMNGAPALERGMLPITNALLPAAGAGGAIALQ